MNFLLFLFNFSFFSKNHKYYYPRKALDRLLSWLRVSNETVINSIAELHGGRLMRALTDIIQVQSVITHKPAIQALRLLGTFGGLNRHFLHETLNIPHERNTTKCMQFQFKSVESASPKLLTLSFGMLIDEALNTIMKHGNIMLSDDGNVNIHKHMQHRMSAMKTIRILISALIWNHENVSKQELENIYQLMRKSHMRRVTKMEEKNDSNSDDEEMVNNDLFSNLNIMNDNDIDIKSMENDLLLPAMLIPLPVFQKLTLHEMYELPVGFDIDQPPHELKVQQKEDILQFNDNHKLLYVFFFYV